MGRVLYTAAFSLATPLVAAYLLHRSRRQPAYREHWRERWAAWPDPPPAPAPTLWLHAVSLGETRAAQPLVSALRARWPGHRLLVTQMTPTGREAARELYPDAAVEYLPYDYPWAARRFLARWRPSLGILMETELWPNLLAAAREARVPMALVNARMSERSAAGYARFGGVAREALASLACVAAQTPDDAQRLEALGAMSPVVTGNLKFDAQPDAALLARGRDWRTAFARPRVWLAASTREGEEALLLRAAERLREPSTLLVLVPRHPQRFDTVARLAQSQGWRVARRSQTEHPGPDIDLWLGDSMGELPAYYAAADLAFVGGSLLPLGGQNLIEACACGVPVLVGQHTFNFAQATQQAIAAGAARRAADADALIDAVAAWLDDDERRAAAALAARDFAAAHRGATARTLALLEPLARGLEQARAAADPARATDDDLR